MKQLYSFLFVSAFLLLSNYINGQDLTDAQKKERCENNKLRLAELEKQAGALEKDLSWSDGKIAEARVQADMLYRIWDKPSDPALQDKRPPEEQLIEIKKIAREYGFDYEKCAVSKRPGSQKPGEDCLLEMSNMIMEKVHKAESEKTRPEQKALREKKADLDKQIAFHRNNLAALGCNDTTDKKVLDGYLKFSGTWQSNWGPVTLNVSNNSVSGNWNQGAGSIGQITGGSYDASTNTLSFTYSQHWNKMTGKVTNITFSEDANKYHLTGTWKHNNSTAGGTWTMWRNK